MNPNDHPKVDRVADRVRRNSGISTLQYPPWTWLPTVVLSQSPGLGACLLLATTTTLQHSTLDFNSFAHAQTHLSCRELLLFPSLSFASHRRNCGVGNGNSPCVKILGRPPLPSPLLRGRRIPLYYSHAHLLAAHGSQYHRECNAFYLRPFLARLVPVCAVMLLEPPARSWPRQSRTAGVRACARPRS